MIKVDTRSIVEKLNPFCTTALEAAAGHCIAQSCYEVQIEHMLQKLCDAPGGDLAVILRHYELEVIRLQRALDAVLGSLRTGSSGRPVWSPPLIEWLQASALTASVEFDQPRMRSGFLLLALCREPDWFDAATARVLSALPLDDLAKGFWQIVEESVETEAADGTGAPPAAAGAESALTRFTIDVTERARQGAIDPVFGRDREIRQIVDILARRRKNNPIIVGEPGVGKTALVEGLALSIAQGEASESLADVRLLTLDLGLLQAGAGVRGEFENRLKQVISEIKASPTSIVLFIDEAHTMIGTGDRAGGNDAANLLKPALARGELRTIAATTWAEYKEHFEEDAALSRRFQVVKVDEPDDDATIVMLRGLVRAYEADHGVRVFDDSVVACAKLGSRYVFGRLHPDKGVDLLDTAAARVKLNHTAIPVGLEQQQRHVETLQRELESVLRDRADGVDVDADRIDKLNSEIAETTESIAVLEAQWQQERELVKVVTEGRRELSGDGLDKTEQAALRSQIEEAQTQLKQVQGHEPMIRLDVTPDVVAEVVSDWTGIPVGKMVADEAETMLTIEDRLKERIKGQDHAIETLAHSIRASRAGVGQPEAPIGVFLCVGPSGVGKTECGLGLADLLFGGERSLTTINMSEFQAEHMSARLIGAPHGYVGFGKGGVLTEAVRKRPYSVVLLDEVEKAHRDVMNLFYQVFDKGKLADGAGREVDFSNTIVYMTSNLADGIITRACESGRPSVDEMVAAIRPTLIEYFRPALVGRMTIVPFYPLPPEQLEEIAVLKLDAIARRVEAEHRMRMVYEPSIAKHLASRCTDVETGARNIDHILRGTLLPKLSTALLRIMSGDDRPAGVKISLNADGDFDVSPLGAAEIEVTVARPTAEPTVA